MSNRAEGIFYGYQPYGSFRNQFISKTVLLGNRVGVYQ